MVAQRRLGGGDDRFPRHGVCGVLLGRVVRPVRHRHRRAGRLRRGFGLIGASQAPSLWQFQFFFGVLIGIAAGSFYAPMVAVASAWIEHRRSLAVALVSAGMGVSPLTVAPFASWLITAYDWRTAMLVIGIASWALLIPASFLVRPAPPAAAPASGGTDAPEMQWS